MTNINLQEGESRKLLLQGKELFNRGDINAAKKCFEKALREESSNPKILNNLAVVYFQQRDSVKALDYLKRALDLDPYNQNALINLFKIFKVFKADQRDRLNILPYFIKSIEKGSLPKKILDFVSGDWEITKLFVETLLKQNIWHKSLKILLNYRVKKFDHLSRDFLLENYSSLRVNICLVMEQGIGNMVMLTPTIRALKSLYPNSFLEVVGKEDSLSVIKGWDLVDRCSDYRNYEFPSDPCVMLLSVWSSGFIRRFRSRLNSFDGPVGHVNLKNYDRHESEYNLDLARFLGYEGSLPSGHCQKDDVDWPFKSDKPVALLSDTTINMPVWQRKRWPYFPGLARELLEKGYQVGLIGGELEAREFQGSKWSEGIINLSGKYTIPQTAHVISKADIFVGNDSGPAHISGIVGTRTIVIFGATREGKNKPLGKRVDIICSDIKCRPCQYTSRWKECNDWQCIKGLSVDDVLLRLSLNTQNKDLKTFQRASK